MQNFNLCILIPAYNYFEGVERILKLVKLEKTISVVISDDSDDEVCASKIKDLVKHINLERIIYVRGPKKGAGENWNSLIKNINGKYYTFLHHDEIYSDLSFLEIIKKNVSSDCFILPCLVVHKNGTRKIHSWQQRTMMFFAQQFLPVFNFLGPTSTVIVRSDLKPKFNVDLNWYIDIEWFHRIFTLSSNNFFCSSKGTFIESHQYENSITKTSIGPIKQIQKKEQAILYDNGYKWMIFRWYGYGFILSKSVFYCINFFSYAHFYSLIILNILKKYFFTRTG